LFRVHVNGNIFRTPRPSSRSRPAGNGHQTTCRHASADPPASVALTTTVRREEPYVKDAQGSPVQGRTRWKRFAAVMVPATVAAGAIVFGMANGAIAASFAVSGSQFKVSADKLEGTGFVQYAGIASEKNAKSNNGIPDFTDPKNHPVAVSGIASAKLTNLCQSVRVPGLPFSLVIHAGGGGNPATATDLLLDVTSLKGDASFTNIQIGIDASDLSKGPTTAKGLSGGFAQQADAVTITNLKQVAWSTTAGQFNLTGLDLSISTGANPTECF
jgi:hypothetical protein